MQFASPYVGMGNNPVAGIDPDGRIWTINLAVCDIIDSPININWSGDRYGRQMNIDMLNSSGNCVNGNLTYNELYHNQYSQNVGGGGHGASQNPGINTNESLENAEYPENEGCTWPLQTTDEKIAETLKSIEGGLNGAGYLSGGIGAIQIGMLDSRSFLSISSKIGTFAKFSSTYRLLGIVGDIAETVNYIGVPLSIGLDYSAMQSGQISEELFTYRTIGSVSSIGSGAIIGAIYATPWGAAIGTIIGIGFIGGEYLYNDAKYIWNETKWQFSNFENDIKSVFYPW